MNTSTQLKTLINNKAKKYNLNPQILLTRFFLEKFLERIALSKYNKNFVLKGGVLISSIIGIDVRMTKDMHLNIQHLPLDEVFIKHALIEISQIQTNDSTKFTLISLLPIRQDFDYSGFTAKFSVEFGKRFQNLAQAKFI